MFLSVLKNVKGLTNRTQFRFHSSEAQPEGKKRTLHELRDEYRHTLARADELQKEIKYFKDAKRKRILLVGSGRSASSAIKYFLQHSQTDNTYVKVGDVNFDSAQKSIDNFTKDAKSDSGLAFQFDVNDAKQRRQEVSEADIVVSLLPSHMHDPVAEDCVALGKDMVTASYTTEKMRQLHLPAKKAGCVIVNELGLDPGIDHMACMNIVDEIKAKGGELNSLETNTGGLVAPESDDNPWGYKFSWAPRNVVLAGAGGCRFLDHGEVKYIPYHKTFQRAEIIDVPGVGLLEAYPNRDSLKYRQIYDLLHVPTLFRGTFRKVGFCDAWDVLVQLGMTDPSFPLADSKHMTYRQFVNSFLSYREGDSVELKLAYYLGISIDSDIMKKLQWLGLFENKQIHLDNASPADIVLSLLERKWAMKSQDKDMIVMWNKFLWDDRQGIPQETITSMAVVGNNADDTAMGTTVGLPLAMTARMILNGSFDEPGVHIPTKQALYKPLLSELEKEGIKFQRSDRPLAVEPI